MVLDFTNIGIDFTDVSNNLDFLMIPLRLKFKDDGLCSQDSQGFEDQTRNLKMDTGVLIIVLTFITIPMTVLVDDLQRVGFHEISAVAHVRSRLRLLCFPASHQDASPHELCLQWKCV